MHENTGTYTGAQPRGCFLGVYDLPLLLKRVEVPFSLGNARTLHCIFVKQTCLYYSKHIINDVLKLSVQFQLFLNLKNVNTPHSLLGQFLLCSVEVLNCVLIRE